MNRLSTVADGAGRLIGQGDTPLPICTPYFVIFPNKGALFYSFSDPVYSFTSLYTKNVRQPLFDGYDPAFGILARMEN